MLTIYFEECETRLR